MRSFSKSTGNTAHDTRGFECKFLRSSMMGIRTSSLAPSKRPVSSSAPEPSSLLPKLLGRNRGSSRCSSNSEAAGSAAARVSERKRGSSTISVVVSASRRMEIELAVLVYRL